MQDRLSHGSSNMHNVISGTMPKGPIDVTRSANIDTKTNEDWINQQRQPIVQSAEFKNIEDLMAMNRHSQQRLSGNTVMLSAD